MKELCLDEVDQVSGGFIPLIYVGYAAAGVAAASLVALGAYIGYNDAKTAAK